MSCTDLIQTTDVLRLENVVIYFYPINCLEKLSLISNKINNKLCLRQFLSNHIIYIYLKNKKQNLRLDNYF